MAAVTASRELTPPPDFDDLDEAHDARERADGSVRSRAVERALAPTVAEPFELPKLGDLITHALDRSERRRSGVERAVPLPWPSVAEHFGGGLWPGVHFLVAGTGIGKTALVLQIALRAATVGVPVGYVGLELDAMQIALRLVGEEARVPWSSLYLGKAGPAYVARARETALTLHGLPFHPYVQRPRGWSANHLAHAAEAMATRYPEPNGAGSRPMLLIVDFLQIIGDELDEQGIPLRLEIRERIGRAAYVMRDLAIRLHATVLCVSSVARDKYGLLSDACGAAGIEWDEDDAKRPINRRIVNPDAIVGLGKESGEIEYSADSVSVLLRVPGTWKGGECDVLFATPKSRATGATWSPMHFTRFGYREADDGGSFTLEAMRAAESAREAKREQKRAAKEQAKLDRLTADAVAIARYVVEHPGCSVRAARVHTVADNPRRWTPAAALLGEALAKEGGLYVNRSKLPAAVCL